MAIAQRQLKVLISSKQSEFAAERADILRTIQPLPLLAANVAEEWAPESTPVERTSVREAAECSIYVGLFGCVYSYPTVLEYQAARANPQRELLIYVKACPTRDAELATFVDTITGPNSGHTVVTFTDWSQVRDRFADHLWSAVGRMIDRLLRLADPPVPMSIGDRSILVRKWQDEATALQGLGLPEDREEARQLARDLKHALQEMGVTPTG